jgi:hypothetical protein
MPHDAGAGVRGEHALKPPHRRVGAVCNGHHSGMHGVADPDATTMMDRDPARPARGVEQRVEQRPVGDRIGAVLHVLGLAVGRCHRSGIQVIAPDHDRRSDPTLLHQPIESRAQLGALTVLQPADAGREALEGHPFLGLPDPAGERALLGEGLQHSTVSHGDVCRVARERHPTEWAGAPAEERSDEFGDEARYVERLTHAPAVRHLAPQVIAVVERHRTPGFEIEHGADVHGHRVQHPAFVGLRVALSLVGSLVERHA